jgi:hypothetical protein
MRRTIVAALVAGLALGGCGGSERHGAATQASVGITRGVVSRAVAVRQLERACLAGQGAAQDRARGRSGKAVFLYAIRENLQTIMDRVDGLEPNDSSRRAFDAYKHTVRVRLDTIARIVNADQSEWPTLINRIRPTMRRAGADAHAAIVRLGARHICV